MSQAPATELFEVRLPEPTPTKFERERRAFFRLLPGLLETHRGQYVAIHDEQVVDSGADRAEVVFRTLDRARADIYVGHVTEERELVLRSGIRRVLGEPGSRP